MKRAGRRVMIVAALGLGLATPFLLVAQEAPVDDAVIAQADPAPAPPPQGDGAAAIMPAMTLAAKAPEEPRDPSRGAVTHLPVPRYVTLKTNLGNARRGPSLTHRIDWVFTRAGMPLRITAEHENWRRVEDAEGVGGWVHYSLLSGVRSILVTQDMAEFHSRPDDASEVVMQAEVGVVGRLMECTLDWCRVRLEVDRGWVRKTAIWGVNADEIVN